VNRRPAFIVERGGVDIQANEPRVDLEMATRYRLMQWSAPVLGLSLDVTTGMMRRFRDFQMTLG
jgi:hypothetical protein